MDYLRCDHVAALPSTLKFARDPMLMQIPGVHQNHWEGHHPSDQSKGINQPVTMMFVQFQVHRQRIMPHNDWPDRPRYSVVGWTYHINVIRTVLSPNSHGLQRLYISDGPMDNVDGNQLMKSAMSRVDSITPPGEPLWIFVLANNKYGAAASEATYDWTHDWPDSVFMKNQRPVFVGIIPNDIDAVYDDRKQPVWSVHQMTNALNDDIRGGMHECRFDIRANVAAAPPEMVQAMNETKEKIDKENREWTGMSEADRHAKTTRTLNELLAALTQAGPRPTKRQRID